MNKHFERDSNYLPEIPRSAYGRIDSIELLSDDPKGGAIIAIDLIDAVWLDSAGANNPMLDLYDSIARSSAWKNFHLKPTGNPFDGAPLFRLETDERFLAQALGQSERDTIDWIQTNENIRNLEEQWFEVSLHENNGVFIERSPQNLYPALFSTPIPVIAKGKLVTADKKRVLSDVFSLHRFPAVSTAFFGTLIANSVADALAVYDVGQGNANALLRDSSIHIPSLYFDLGAGVYRNSHTTPSDLRFCFSSDPCVILSHWDADHWAGTYATKVGGEYPALQRTWIAPLQSVTPTHVTFAYEVLANGGKLFTYHPSPSACGVHPIDVQVSINFVVGSGTSRNNSGIVLSVVNTGHPNGPRCWLLTGDCDYKYFMTTLAPPDPVALVVPHHGASLDGRTIAPGPAVGDTYRRLIYSFGPKNSHGRSSVCHPTNAGIAAHHLWNHGTWTSAGPGIGVPGGDVRATSDHANPPQRGGALVGWHAAPALSPLPCGGVSCSAPLTQT